MAESGKFCSTQMGGILLDDDPSFFFLKKIEQILCFLGIPIVIRHNKRQPI